MALAALIAQPRAHLPPSQPLATPTRLHHVFDLPAGPEPTAWAGISRRQNDPLGWDDPYTCNVGVCPMSLACTVFQTLARRPMGICCELGKICQAQTACIPYSAGLSTWAGTEYATETLGIIDRGTIFCGAARPYCVSFAIDYGYKSDTLHLVNCFTEDFTSTTRNTAWTLYTERVDDTRSFEGPLISTLSTPFDDDAPSGTTTTNSQPSQTSEPEISLQEAKNSLSAGQIAGIVIGCIALLCIAAVVIAFLYFRRRKHAPAPTAPENPQMAVYNPYYPPQSPPLQQAYAPGSYYDPHQTSPQQHYPPGGGYFSPTAPVAGTSVYGGASHGLDANGGNEVSPPLSPQSPHHVNNGTHSSMVSDVYPPSTQPLINNNPHSSAYPYATVTATDTSSNSNRYSIANNENSPVLEPIDGGNRNSYYNGEVPPAPPPPIPRKVEEEGGGGNGGRGYLPPGLRAGARGE